MPSSGDLVQLRNPIPTRKGELPTNTNHVVENIVSPQVAHLSNGQNVSISRLAPYPRVNDNEKDLKEKETSDLAIKFRPIRTKKPVQKFM